MPRFILISSMFCLFFIGSVEAFSVESISTSTPTEPAVNTSATTTEPAPIPALEPMKLLIVPGHDDEYSGAVFLGVREADMNLLLAEKIRDQFVKDKAFDVVVARDVDGYIPPLADYFEDGHRKIDFFIRTHKKKTERFLEKSDIVPDEGVVHNDAPALAAYRLYGINKWAAEEDFDAVLHVHFNDEAGRNWKLPGEHTGYSIYIPSEELPNHKESLAFGNAVGSRLLKSVYKSNLPLEMENALESGAIPDFKLIAVGSNMTLEIPSILVEYSYIYESMVSPLFMGLSTDVMAGATATGIRDYYSGAKSVSKNLKYQWFEGLSENKEPSIPVAALQYALFELGQYPPATFTREDCPLTGRFGPCTKEAVKDFQASQGLKADGIVGNHTLGILNYLFR